MKQRKWWPSFHFSCKCQSGSNGFAVVQPADFIDFSNLLQSDFVKWVTVETPYIPSVQWANRNVFLWLSIAEVLLWIFYWEPITPCQKRWPGSRAAGCSESHDWTGFSLLWAGVENERENQVIDHKTNLFCVRLTLKSTWNVVLQPMLLKKAH